MSDAQEDATGNGNPTQSSPAPEPKRKRRLGRFLLFGLLLAGGLVGFAPQFASPFVKGKVVGALSETFGGETTLQNLTIRWPGTVRIEDLALNDPQGRPMLRIQSLTAHAKPIAALRGSYRAEADLKGFELHMRQEADGAWNWSSQEDSSPSDPADPKQEGEETTLDLQARIAWNDGTLVLHGPGGSNRFVRFEGSAVWPGQGKLGTLQANLSLPGNKGGEPERVLHLEGSFHSAEKATLETLAGEMTVLIESLATDDLNALVDPQAGPSPEGTLNGEFRFKLDPGKDLNAVGTMGFAGSWPVPTEDSENATVQGAQVVDSTPGAASEVEGPPIKQTQGLARLEQVADLSFDLHATPSEEGMAISVSDLRYQSPTASFSVKGSLAVGSDAEQLSANLSGEIETPLERLAKDLRPLFALEDLDLSGKLNSNFKVRGTNGRLQATGTLNIEDLDLTARLDIPEEAPSEALSENSLIEDVTQPRDPKDGLKANPGAPTTRDLRVQDRNLQLDWDIDLDRIAQTARLQKVSLQSEVISGDLTGVLVRRTDPGTAPPADPSSAKHSTSGDPATPPPAKSVADIIELQGVHAELSYIPDRLGALIGPWLTGKLSGSEPRDIELTLHGLLADMDPWSILHGLEGKATIGLGQYDSIGFVTSGQLDLEGVGNAVIAKGNLLANGGQVTLDSRWNIGPALKKDTPEDGSGKGTDKTTGQAEVPSTFSLSIQGLQTNPKVSSMLGFVHPAFQAMDQSRAGDVSGLLSASLDLQYNAPVSESWLQGDFASIDWNLLEGTGRLQVSEATFSSSPLVVEVMKLLGKPSSTPIRLKPLEFSIVAGRLSYVNPWDWTVEGEQTQFSGSVGLDQSIDLMWTVPISEKLARKHKVLKALIGESIQVPIGGSLTRPKINIQASLQSLAKRALEREAKDHLQEAIDKKLKDEIGKGIDDLIGGAKGKPGEDPQDLLNRANALYASGKKAEAKILYQKIRSDHELSIVYLLNKSRIKRRARE